MFALGQRLRHFADHVTQKAGAANGERVRRWFQEKTGWDAVLADPGIPDPVAPEAVQHPVEALPDEVLVFLLGSRYCDTDRLSDTAWSLFGHVAPGWARVQAI